VPHGASWVDVSIKTSGFDTPWKFYLDAVQKKFAA
jgi:tripeptidyl-peptidase-2